MNRIVGIAIITGSMRTFFVLGSLLVVSSALALNPVADWTLPRPADLGSDMKKTAVLMPDVPSRSIDAPEAALNVGSRPQIDVSACAASHSSEGDYIHRAAQGNCKANPGADRTFGECVQRYIRMWCAFSGYGVPQASATAAALRSRSDGAQNSWQVLRGSAHCSDVLKYVRAGYRVDILSGPLGCYGFRISGPDRNASR